MLPCKCVLSFAVHMQQVAEIFAEVPQCVDCDVDSEVCVLRFVDWDLEDKLAYPVEFA